MKNVFRISRITMLILSIFLIHSCKKVEEKLTPPVLTTKIVTEITQTTALGGGDITSDGGTEVTERGVCWGIVSNPSISGSRTMNGTGKGSFNSTIIDLSANTKYYLKAYATNNEGTAYGNEVTFTTIAAIPTITTKAFSNITFTTAVSGGTNISDGGSQILSKGLCWGITTNPTITDSKTFEGSGIESFGSTLTGLQSGTNYFVRSYATNNIGTGYGNELILSTLPLLKTTEASEITSNSAKSGGFIYSDLGISITARGVCWSVNENPTILDSHTIDGSGMGSYTSNLTNLLINTIYYIRAYSSNNSGTVYGNQIKIRTYTGNVTDIEGNVYKTIAIGTQIWMAENLETTKYNDGTNIPIVTGGNIWELLTTPGTCWIENIQSNKDIFGSLYNWFTVSTGKLCPIGWHVPNEAEFTTLLNLLGGNNEAGPKLKETGISHWYTPNSFANNETGFTALGGGVRQYAGSFAGIRQSADFWSSTEVTSSKAGMWVILGTSTFFGKTDAEKRTGASIRCLLNN